MGSNRQNFDAKRLELLTIIIKIVLKKALEILHDNPFLYISTNFLLFLSRAVA